MDREGTPTTAVEPLAALPPRRLGFLAGVAVGVTLTVIAAQIWLAITLEPYGAMMRAFGGSLRNLSALALSRGWRWGVPVASSIALVATLALGARRWWIYATVAGLAIAAFVATYFWAIAPLTDLAGNVR